MNDIQQLNERITYLEGVIANMTKTGSYTFKKDVVLYNDIVIGTAIGTKIGTEGGASGQKIALWGTTPVVQPAAIADVAAGGADSDGTARTKINAILAALRLPGYIDT